MSVSKDAVMEMLYGVIDSTNKHLAGKKLEKSLDFELYGDNGNLDSMDLVSFIVDVEQAIDKTFNSPVVLADEKSLSQFNSPFKSVETLLNYIITKLSDV